MYRIFVDGALERPTFIFNEMAKPPEDGDIFKVNTNVYTVYDVHYHLENHVLYYDAHLQPLE